MNAGSIEGWVILIVLLLMLGFVTLLVRSASKKEKSSPDSNSPDSSSKDAHPKREKTSYLR